MEDILDSRRRAMIQQGWIYGERMNRIGDPFKWVDGDQLSQFKKIDGELAFLQFLSMSGEIYNTPQKICTDYDDKLRQDISQNLRDSFKYFVPFKSLEQLNFEKYIESTASVKQQDYSAIKTFCKGLGKGIHHLDIGPGLGANALYSHLGFDSCYYALEAFPSSYQVQRDFFKYLSTKNPYYLDTIACENFGLTAKEITNELSSTGKYNYKHVPSWNAELVQARSIDLVTATWVLNEVNPAGICWLLYNATNFLKEGGWFYIRDSHKLKPLRHDLNYDSFLTEKLGFKQVGFLDIQNRIDMHGIPRVYQKISSIPDISFESIYELAFGRFAVTSHSGAYMQK